MSNERHWIHFKDGNLSGLYLLITDNYAKTYHDGNADKEMMDSIVDNKTTGKVIFDVGAFIGASSLVFSKIVGETGSVIAFEPNPYSATRFEKIMRKNPKYSKNIQLFRYALSDENKTIQMHLSEDIDIGHSSTSRIEGSHSTIRNIDLPEGFKNVSVQAKTLDTFVHQNNILPDTLKVDIEGAEYEFLLGAIETIRKAHPTFYIEFHSPFCATKCTEFLFLEGYSIDVIREEEDNRVMVLAKYVRSGSQGADVEKLKSLNHAFSIIKTMSDSLSNINSELQVNERQNIELRKENHKLTTEIKRMEEVESSNKELLMQISEMENSRSWNITRPFRKFSQLIRTVKK